MVSESGSRLIVDDIWAMRDDDPPMAALPRLFKERRGPPRPRDMPSEANGDIGVPEWGRQPRVWDGIGASGFFHRGLPDAFKRRGDWKKFMP